jgi:hypothetical protein
MRRIIATLAWPLLFAAGGVFAQACPLEGSGTINDPKQNVLKNRVTGPAHPLDEITVTQFKQTFTPNLGLPRHRFDFSDAQLALVAPDEQRGVVLTGYILRAVKQSPENTNCNDPARIDVHMWIYSGTSTDKAKRTALRARAVVVEATPSWQDQHPNWTATQLEKKAAARVKVRISGWVMYDPEHPDKIGKTRGTLWEIHPVTRIEYWTGTDWKDL